MKKTNEFSLKDFYLAACLLASGLFLKRLERQEGKIVTFVFDDPNNTVEKIIHNYWNRTQKLPTRNLIEAIVELKTRIHNGI